MTSSICKSLPTVRKLRSYGSFVVCLLFCFFCCLFCLVNTIPILFLLQSQMKLTSLERLKLQQNKIVLFWSVAEELPQSSFVYLNLSLCIEHSEKHHKF